VAGAENARDHGYARDGVQWFRYERTHAGARTRGKHDETDPIISLR
jgi:hypothetical protein